jgi:heterodisulfide reductase subunit C
MINSALRRELEVSSGEKISACFQCQKCSNGCAFTPAMDILPHELMHRLQLGLVDEVVNSDTVWVCASCETCTTRCPNDIDIAHIMDTLRQMSVKRGVKKSQRKAPLFHAEFLASIKRFGRLHEASMVSLFALKDEGVGGLLKQAGMGLDMLRKGKIKLMPDGLGGRVKDIFKKAQS